MNFKEKYIVIHKNDLCPCGSNKRFGDCCSSLKHMYTTFGENYDGCKVIIDKTNEENIVNKFKSILPDISQKGMSVTQGKEQLKKIYSIMDEGLKEFHRQSSCKKGCNICCCDYVDCSAVEAELIREYVVNKFGNDDINKLEKGIKNNINNAPKYKSIRDKDKTEISEIVNDYFNKRIKCMFLNTNGECSIYQVRPVVCRKHLVISNPENCNKNDDCKMIIPGFMNSIYLNVDVLTRNITRYRKLTFLGEEISDEEALKCLKKGMETLSVHRSFYEWFKNGFDSISLNI